MPTPVLNIIQKPSPNNLYIIVMEYNAAKQASQVANIHSELTEYV